MRKRSYPQAAAKDSEFKSKFDLNLDIINKRLDKLAETISEAGSDGVISHIELTRIVTDLRILEKLLINFHDDEFNTKIAASRQHFQTYYKKIKKDKLDKKKDSKFGFATGAGNEQSNLQLLYTEHILEYLGELVRVAARASFMGGETSG